MDGAFQLSFPYYTNYLFLFQISLADEKKIENYVGHDVAEKMKHAAMGNSAGFENIPAAG